MPVTDTSLTPTLNADMGEGLGLLTFGNDANLMKFIDIANVACGFHSGDPNIMRSTVQLAKHNDVRVGAHPGLPDLSGFGRRPMNLSPEDAENLIIYQVGALQGFLDSEGMELNHIKPHGALYGMLARDEELMRPVAQLCKSLNVSFFGLSGTTHERVCREFGVNFVGELYVDLDYDDEGNLLIQRSPEQPSGATVAKRLEQALSTGTISSVNGETLNVSFDTVCIHSDGPRSVDIAEACWEVLNAEKRASE